MRVSKIELLGMLPASRDEWVMINPDQGVRDIIAEVLEAHKEFAGDYDVIAPFFDVGSTEQIASAIYWFLKNEIEYREEGDEWQSTAIPAGILSRGFGDCKHYASFAGGVLDALNRRGKNIKWVYRFASYHITDSTPHHVFVVIKNGSDELWIDPTPGASSNVPIWQVDKKVKGMALYRQIAGIGDLEDPAAEELTVVAPDVNAVTQDDLVSALDEIDTSVDMTADQYAAIELLIKYQVINEDGSIQIARLDEIIASLPEADAGALRDAYSIYSEYSHSTVGGMFSGLWRGVKTVSLAIPRNAFLGLVALNVFGMASKMSRLLSIPEARKKLVDKWYALGGKENGIIGAINSGAKKKAILGTVNSNRIGVVAAAAPAWLAVAGGIIAAIMPLVTSLLKQNNAYTSEFQALDNNQMYAPTTNIFDTIKNFIVQNPIPSAAAAGLIVYMVWKD